MASLPAGLDLCAVPSIEPPEGETFNFVNPTSLAPTMIAVSTIVTLWASVFVAIRVWVNRRKLKVADCEWKLLLYVVGHTPKNPHSRYPPDPTNRGEIDFIIIGIIWDIAFTAMILSQSRFYRHQWDVPACWFTGQYMKIVFLITALFSVISLCKAAVLLMYLQLFSVSRRMRIAVWIGLVFDFLIYIPSIPIAAIYEAPRPGHSWDEMIVINQQYQQGVLVPYGITTGATSVLLDFYIFILPLPIIMKLNLSLSKKIQVALVFMTALCGVAASVTALVYRIRLLNLTDTSWEQACFYISMIVENNVVIIVSCMPFFANFVKQNASKFPSFRGLPLHFQRPIKDLSSTFSSNRTPSLPRPVLRTFGSIQQRVQPHERYHELNEWAYGKSQATVQSEGGTQLSSSVPEYGDTVILKTSDVFQHTEPYSTNRGSYSN
ncbi:hypothetical protein F5Y13DRAFT_189572 [Hypoxylon sp. FL1857]|nr:hypothetical protein F5Y13DRAFT_189572 [Hypoxylon sp. FL1857]